MSDSDVFREVDEDYRRERMVAFWRRYGTLVFGLVIAALIAAGVLDYLHRRTLANQAAATQALDSLISQAHPGNEMPAADALVAYAAKADGSHATLALLAAAALRQRAGQLDGAAALYHQIADGSTGASADLRDLAVVRIGYLALDQANPEPILPRVQAIANGNGPWRSSAREAAALLTAKAGQRDQAAKMLSDLAQDPGAPADLAERARALADLYRGK